MNATITFEEPVVIVDRYHRNNGGRVVHRIAAGEYAVKSDGPDWSQFYIELPSVIIEDVYVNRIGAHLSPRVTEPMTPATFRSACFRTPEDVVASVKRSVR